MAETPGALPSLTGDTKVRTTAGAIRWLLGIAICATAGGSVWATKMAGAVDTLAEKQATTDAKLDKLSGQVMDLQLQLARMGLVTSSPAPGKPMVVP